MPLKVKVKSLSSVWFFATTWTVAYQAPPCMGFSRQECWSGLPFPSPGDLPNPGIEPRFPALQADTLSSAHMKVNLILKIVEDSCLVLFISSISSTLLANSHSFLLFTLPTSWFVNFLVPQTPKSSIGLSQRLPREGQRACCSAPHPLYLCFCLSLILLHLEKNKIRKDCIHMVFCLFSVFLNASLIPILWTSLVAQMVKRLSTMCETRVLSLGREDPLEKEMAIYSSTTAWKILWTEELGRLQSVGSQRVRHNWATSLDFTSWTSLMAQMVKRLPTMQETQVQSLGWEDPLEKEMYSCLENPMDRGEW